MNRMIPSARAYLLIAAACIFLVATASSAGSAEKLKIAIPALASELAPYWIAVDRGFFKAEGLEVELPLITGNTRGVQALLAGEVQGGIGGAASPVAAVVQGSKIVVVEVEKNVMDFILATREPIKTPSELADKKFGVSSLGSSSHVATLMALRELGVDPSRATMLQVGGAASRIAAIKNGSVFAAAVSGTVFAGRGKEFGLYKVVDLAEKGIDYPYSCLYVTSRYAAENRRTVLGVIRSLVKGIRFYYANKDESVNITARHFRNPDRDVLSREWDFVTRTKLFQELPYPTKQGFDALFKGMAVDNPKIASLRMEDVVDLSFLDQLSKEGFFKQSGR